jgi:uncharacterized protein
VIRARFFNNGGVTCGFEISGHAGFAGKGTDIVCASVSSAVQMAANTITEVIGAAAHVCRSNGKVAFMLMHYTDSGKIDTAVAVINGLRLQLSLLSKLYRGTISIEDSEV